MEALLYQCEYSKFESASKGTDILSNAYASAPVQGIHGAAVPSLQRTVQGSAAGTGLGFKVYLRSCGW